jgi:hypothetical protein
MCRVVHESYRRALIRRFPYAVFYEPSAATVQLGLTPDAGQTCID